MYKQESIIKNSGTGINFLKKKPVKKSDRKKEDYQLSMDESLIYNYQNSDQWRIDEFKDYLKRTEKEIFTILFSDNSSIETAYKHRWSKSYQKGIISKFYQLNTWFHRHGMKVGMLSLTTAQKGYSDIEIIIRLRDGWAKLQDNLNKRGYLSFKLFEMHDTTGKAHLHVMIIGDLNRDVIGEEYYYGEYPEGTIGHLWCNKYELGDGVVGWDKKFEIYKDHSFDFSLSPDKKNHIVNYLMSYLRKNLASDIINDEKALKFHSLFWKTGMKLFSCSRYLSFVMKKLKIQSKNIVTLMMVNNKDIYDHSKSTSYPCKYQQINGCRYKYKLQLFEIKNKFNFAKIKSIDNNYNIQKMFNLWDAMI